ncbi:adenylate kinase 8 isoform X1 [Scyliorhinus canicula]|uniref:adenylate kinase 8 isoform X1 n=1 Tax=Scyliorhinus canicula TaxID=7830 RepID=UPI0018F74F40|nr:adenylate kinase 8 isoform X1 [Scyliorhinus canicula]
MDATKKPFRISPELGVYAEKHGIFQILQRMLQCLLVDKPMEPIQYMIDHLKSENDDVPRVFLLGPTASGKLTIAKLLCDKLGSNVLTLENMMANKSDIVTKIQRFNIKNKEIPNTLWAKLILERLSETDCIKRGWILVGYPKTQDQALALQENGIAPEHVVILDAPDTVLIERNLGKRVDMSTGEIYHTTFNWPTSSKVQKRLVKPNGIKEKETVKALLEYRRVSHGILNSYSKKYHIVNADQPSVDVYSQVMSHVQSRHRSNAPYTPRIIIHGPPGSGRSLQAALIAEKYRIVNVSCGQLLKEPVAAETRLGEAIKPYVESRQPVPDVMVMKCISQRLSKLDCSTRGWVLHGFPQDAGQAEMLKDAGFSPNRVFFLDVPDDAAIERLTVRLTDPVTGERYHSIYKPAPTSEVYSRCKIHPKDSEENVQQALEVYHANVQDLEEFYNPVIHVNADQDPYTVFEYIESCVVKPLSKHTNVFV